ncbi:hypothetical protein JCM8547_006907 [Rhodosporidiobolus lusitaniae]
MGQTFSSSESSSLSPRAFDDDGDSQTKLIAACLCGGLGGLALVAGAVWLWKKRGGSTPAPTFQPDGEKRVPWLWRTPALSSLSSLAKNRSTTTLTSMNGSKVSVVTIPISQLEAGYSGAVARTRARSGTVSTEEGEEVVVVSTGQGGREPPAYAMGA